MTLDELYEIFIEDKKIDTEMPMRKHLEKVELQNILHRLSHLISQRIFLQEK